MIRAIGGRYYCTRWLRPGGAAARERYETPAKAPGLRPGPRRGLERSGASHKPSQAGCLPGIGMRCDSRFLDRLGAHRTNPSRGSRPASSLLSRCTCQRQLALAREGRRTRLESGTGIPDSSHQFQQHARVFRKFRFEGGDVTRDRPSIEQIHDRGALGQPHRPLSAFGGIDAKEVPIRGHDVIGIAVHMDARIPGDAAQQRGWNDGSPRTDRSTTARPPR